MTNEFQVVKTAAVAVVGADLLQGEKFAKATYSRTLSAISVVGSAAIGDFAVEIWAGEARKGVFYNTAAGAAVVPLREDEKFPKALIPANSQLMAIVIDAAAANNVVLQFKFDSAKRRRAYGGYSRAGGYSRPWRPTARFPTRESWLATRGR